MIDREKLDVRTITGHLLLDCVCDDERRLAAGSSTASQLGQSPVQVGRRSSGISACLS